jgi:hypothetical protein
MKRCLLIFGLFFTTLTVFAQGDNDEEDGNEKIRDKMSEFIQRRLDLNKDEASKFAPLFIRYFKEWRQTIRENKGDRLILQQKIVELRLRYRPQFREVIGEQRGSQVFQHQDIFIQRLRDERNERMRANPNRPFKRPRVNRVF